jgi:hypothetical protein
MRRWLIGISLMIGLASMSEAAVTLAWDASAGATGYRIHAGRVSGIYDTVQDVGPALTATLLLPEDGSTYVFAATAYNAVGASAFSNEVSVQLMPPTLAPLTVTITDPVDGSRILRSTKQRPRTQTLKATASAPGGVARVEFLVDGVLTCADTTVPYTCPWHVPKAANQRYRLNARAIDTAGNANSSPMVEVIVP